MSEPATTVNGGSTKAPGEQPMKPFFTIKLYREAEEATKTICSMVDPSRSNASKICEKYTATRSASHRSCKLWLLNDNMIVLSVTSPINCSFDLATNTTTSRQSRFVVFCSDRLRVCWRCWF